MWLLLTAALGSPCTDSIAVDSLLVKIDLVASSSESVWSVRFRGDACPDGLDLSEVPGASLDGEPAPGEEGWTTANVVRIDPIETSSADLDPWRALAESTEVRFRFGRKVPLQVYTDPSAHQHRKGNDLVVWWDKGDRSLPGLIWTTWNDWAAAGKTLGAPLQQRVPKVSELGSLGRSLRGASLESLISRLDATVDLAKEGAPSVGWTRGREPKVVLGTGRGTPSERGLILMAMLKGAGFDARPAWFSPTDDPDTPRTLPAPHLLPFPAVAVKTGKATLYFDPGVRGARPPGVPARMRGGRVLVAGQHIVIPNDTGAPQGEVRVDAQLTVSVEGRMVFDAKVLPTGSAEQALRSAFTGLEAQQWPGVVSEWLTPRGEVRDLVVGVNGLDGMEPFTVDIRYTEPKRLVEMKGALQGPFLDPVAPGLAKLLPPGVAIAERIEVLPPEGMFALTAVQPEVERVPELVLNRSLAQEEGKLTLSHDWHVLLSGAVDAAIDGQVGETDLLLFPSVKGPAKRAVKSIQLPEGDQQIITALVLYHLDLPKPAGKVLKKLHKTLGVEEITDLLARYASVGDRRPWEELVGLVDSDAERIAAIRGLEAIGDRRLGWQLATSLTQSEDPETRTRAFVEVARLQGPRTPDGRADPEGQKAWREPIKLLEYAHKRAGSHEDLTRLPLILAYLRGGRAMDASELLDDRSDAPAAKAAEAEYGAVTGIFGVDVLGLINEALAEAPYDADVRRSVGRALAAIGLRRQGVSNVLLAAELTGNDHAQWVTAADYAAKMGDLGAALYASRRSSDLVPSYVEPALKLQYYARLTGDDEALQVGVDRLRQEMHVNLVGELSDLIEQEPEAELALLRHHADEVERSRTLLRRRAELHFERAMFEDAALDGSLLLDQHKDPTGARYLLAGASSRFWHADPLKVLGRYSTTGTAKVARMDIQIVAGDRVSASGSRVKTWNLVRRNPNKLATSSPTWPVGMKDFESEAPEGFKKNRSLSSVRGVLGWSSSSLQRSILRTERSTGAVPPPLSNLYTNGPTVLSTDRGASVIRLDGGGIPIYAGLTASDGQDVVGLGLTPAAARDAVLQGIGQLQVP